ncbi:MULTISPECIES: zinc-finger-containing protein [Bacillus cereus group]|uniref:zinc-finger-containing protein n=1 Tax=Bacillus cereus group TaxID=86661 RepID=UPI001F574329|nr:MULTISPECIES: zinc-finger-containing protein [Bacillus cereus group]USL16590.1 DUF3268 family zinc-finger domain-containing protein [Bacillus thuringiensis]
MDIPKKCTFCNGEVVLTSNKELYGKEYGNGKCYLCRKCKASVGTHNGTTRPLGILANREMKILKKTCHDLFDITWKNKILNRTEAYKRLARLLGIKQEDCHFGHFEIDMLINAIKVLSDSNWYKQIS